MGFFFTGMWGAIWLGALVAASLVTLAGDNRKAWGICAVMWCNWIGTRSIVTFDTSNDIAWLLLDFTTVIVLLTLCSGRAAKSVATLFTIILALNVNDAAGFADFEQTAAMADLLGFVMLVIMAGAAHAEPGGGKLAGGLGRIRFGSGGVVAAYQARRKVD
jgi:hypothetical protein